MPLHEFQNFLKCPGDIVVFHLRLFNEHHRQSHCFRSGKFGIGSANLPAILRDDDLRLILAEQRFIEFLGKGPCKATMSLGWNLMPVISEITSGLGSTRDTRRQASKIWRFFEYPEIPASRCKKTFSPIQLPFLQPLPISLSHTISMAVFYSS